jgi:hypothetical protein
MDWLGAPDQGAVSSPLRPLGRNGEEIELTICLRRTPCLFGLQTRKRLFSALKTTLSSAPVLALPDFALPFAIETDACASSVGVVLTQRGHPLAFISNSLGPKNRGLSTYEKEYLAILVLLINGVTICS